MFLKKLIHRCFASKTTQQLTQLILDNLQIKTTVYNDVVDNADMEQANDTVYINTGDTVCRADGNPLTDDDVERLIDFGKTQALQEEWMPSRTKREEELEDSFFIKYLVRQHSNSDIPYRLMVLF